MGPGATEVILIRSQRMDTKTMGTSSVRHRLRQIAKSLGLLVPPFRAAFEELQGYRHVFRFVPPGHFYSPIPSVDEVRRDAHRLFGPAARTIPGIDLNEPAQLTLLGEITRYYRDLAFPDTRSPGFRYFYQNPTYSYSDAIFLYGMIRHASPKRIVEVGSGSSSCLMLDTIDRHLDHQVDCTFIEPYPDRLLALLNPEDPERVAILRERVQDVDPALLLSLDRNDILFIDSSHTVKIGSDVTYLLGEILPRLRPGVYVHFHDVFYPFEYPEAWVTDGRAWNEAYALRAFLAFNEAFEIVLFNTYLQRFHREIFERDMPQCLRNEGASIWLRRVP
jgi:predicted O-methyltransferase YrrM